MPVPPEYERASALFYGYLTSGAVNPTSTIQAMALYIGDSIKTNIADLF